MPNKRKRHHKESSVSSHLKFLQRNIDHLFVQRETYECAVNSTNPCIPCAYKIAAFDIALDTDFTSVVPNTRPELCPRYNQTICTNNRGSKLSSYGYQNGMNVLTVGDGDFSFSLALARILCTRTRTRTHTRTEGFSDKQHSKTKEKERRRKGKQKMETNKIQIPAVVATSYESLDTLKKVYPSISDTIHELEELGCRVFYNVDATDLEGTLPHIDNINIDCDDDDNHGGGQSLLKYDRIAWNFPCTAEKNGQDGQNQQMADNQRLIKSFVKQCGTYLRPNHGEIHLLHKTKPPYDQWGIEKVAVDDELWSTCTMKRKCSEKKGNQDVVDKSSSSSTSTSTSSSCPFEYRGRMVFDKCLLPPYTPRKALHKKSFTCHDACMYIFGWKEQKLNRNDTDGEEEQRMLAQSSSDFAPTIIPKNIKCSMINETLPVADNTCERSNEKNTDDGGDCDKKSNGDQQGEIVLNVTKKMIEEIRTIHLREGSQKDRKKRRMTKGSKNKYAQHSNN